MDRVNDGPEVQLTVNNPIPSTSNILQTFLGSVVAESGMFLVTIIKNVLENSLVAFPRTKRNNDKKQKAM